MVSVCFKTLIFDEYVSSKTTLKQFVEQYQNALLSKVKKENEADYESFDKWFKCDTPYEFEKQFRDAYTNEKFLEFRNELKGKTQCGLSSVNENVGTTEFVVYEDVEVWESSIKRVLFKVILNEEGDDVKCICRLFEVRGILCRHIIVALIQKQIYRISEKYILRRWMKNVDRCHTKVKISYDNWSSKPEAHRFNKMCNLFYEVADLATNSDQNCDMVMEFINDLKLKLTASPVTCEGSQRASSVIDGSTQVEELKADTSSKGCKILDPRGGGRKGRPRTKRLQSTVEKVVKKIKRKNQMDTAEKKKKQTIKKKNKQTNSTEKENKQTESTKKDTEKVHDLPNVMFNSGGINVLPAVSHPNVSGNPVQGHFFPTWGPFNTNHVFGDSRVGLQASATQQKDNENSHEDGAK